MLVRKIQQYESIPLFYAPYRIDPVRNWECHVTFIGLNILFYFIYEFYRAFIGFGRMIKEHRKSDYVNVYSSEQSMKEGEK